MIRGSVAGVLPIVKSNVLEFVEGDIAFTHKQRAFADTSYRRAISDPLGAKSEMQFVAVTLIRLRVDGRQIDVAIRAICDLHTHLPPEPVEWPLRRPKVQACNEFNGYQIKLPRTGQDFQAVCREIVEVAKIVEFFSTTKTWAHDVFRGGTLEVLCGFFERIFAQRDRGVQVKPHHRRDLDQEFRESAFLKKLAACSFGANQLPQ
jgi:hypothetical protein